MRSRPASCPKCGVPFLRGAHPTHKKACSTHHIIPKRNGGKWGPTIEICRACHDEIERLIPFEEQPHWVYFAIVEVFLAGHFDEETL